MMKNIDAHLSIWSLAGGDTLGITVVYRDRPERAPRTYQALGISTGDRPVFEHCTAQPGPHLGRRVAWHELPPGPRALLLQQRPELFPSPEGMQALREYANRHRRGWRMRLMEDWQRGGTVGPLRILRNEFGPKWIHDNMPAGWEF